MAAVACFLLVRRARNAAPALYVPRNDMRLPACVSGTAASAHHLVAPCVVLASTASRAEDAHSLLLVAAGVSGARLAYANLADLAEGKIEAVQYAEVATGGEALLPEIAHASAAGALQLRALGSGLAALDLASGLTVAVLHASPRNTHVSALSPTVLSRWVTGAAVSPPVQLNLGAPTLHIAAALHLADDIGGGTTVEVVDVGAARIVHTERFLQHNASAHGMPTAAFLGGYSRRDGGNGFRVAVTSEDASYALLQQGQVVWAREEALADVVDTLLLEPPDTFSGDSTAAMSYVPAMLGAAAVRRLALDGIGSVLRSLSSKQSQNKTANSFAAGGGRGRGVDPVFVVLTACGKVLGLSTELGAVVWSWWPPADAPRPRTLLLWRGSHAPQLLLAGSALDGAATRLVWLDAHTGAVAGSTTLPLRAARLVPLSVLDAEGRRIVLLWEPASGEVAVFPNTLQAAAAALSTASKLFLHAIDGHGGVVNGYTVTAPPGAGLRAVPAWSVVLHSPVIASAVRPPGDVVFSRTRVRGDRSTAYKFLSPNTLLLVTCAPPDAHHAVAGLEVFILDTVTGRFLYRVRHAAASGPVTATAADNWFVYAYWSEAAQRTEVSVLELFEDGVARSSGSLSAAIAGALAPRTAGGSHGDTSSSLVPPTLRVLGQTYSLGVQLAALGVTVTRRGLASRHLLLGTRSGRVVALDRRFVDPRRPTRPTAADREEGLVPYSEALPLLPGAYLTGAARAARIRGVHAAPATLESACHVLAYGLDVVYARTAPSQTFDTLGSGFSRALLAITLTLLSAGAAAAGWAVRRDNLSRRWQ
jgi:hypothetical protein